ncbi:MAG: LiaF domain-containing protein [Bacteroidota bacterium]
MKMGFINSGAFWGVIIILLGVSMVLRYVFNIHLPVFRVCFAFFLIFIGVRMLMGTFGGGGRSNTIVFSDGNYKYSKSQSEYNVVFGEGNLDLRNVTVSETETIHINNVFGNYTIRINDSVPVMVKSSVVFGEVQTPDDNNNSFGKNSYRSANYSDAVPHIIIDANVVFGDLKVIKE